MSLVLRDYQNEIVNEARSLMAKGHRTILICSPTGSGKTALTTHMLGTAASKGLDSWFLVHRRELVKQSAMAFHKGEVPHGIVAAGFPQDLNPKVQIASIGTIANRYRNMREPRLLIWDECHHITAGSWAKIKAAFPKAFHIGLTATPQRLDGKGLEDHFKTMIKGPSVSELISRGYLADYLAYAPGGVDMSGVQTRMGDFVKSQVASVVDRPTITGSAIIEYRRRAAGKKAVIFCSSIEHSQHVVAQFLSSGIRAAHVDGETPTAIRDNAIKDFQDGRIDVLSNVDLFGEGFDLPAIEVMIDLSPTQSLAKFLQRCGRVLRPSPGKDKAIILDHVGNIERHGLPDDDRTWSLKGREKSKNKKDSGAPIKICQSCYAAQPTGSTQCKFCGFAFEIKGREIEQVEGELVEIDKAAMIRKRKIEQGSAQTMEDLVEIGRARGMKRPHLWAKHVWNARQAKKLREGR